MVAIAALGKPLREAGAFFAFSADTLTQFFRPPYAWREFVIQSWFVARVSAAPGILLALPFNVLVMFILNIVLLEIGAGDASGTGSAVMQTQIGPAITVFTVGGAATTAMCADLGARTIRDEIDAMRVMGIDPIRRLAVPRVAALTVNAFLLNAVLFFVGMGGCYLFSVYVQHVAPGSFMASLTLIVGVRDVIICFVKAAMFGLAGGLIACFKGFTVGGGPQGVGNAVNETVVYTFLALFVINTLMTAFNARLTA